METSGKARSGPTIRVREPDATLEPAPQNSQLMPKHRVLSLKPHLRLGWRGQDSQDETQKPDHSTSLSDSVTSSTRIRFSVRTGIESRQVPVPVPRETRDTSTKTADAAEDGAGAVSESPDRA